MMHAHDNDGDAVWCVCVRATWGRKSRIWELETMRVRPGSEKRTLGVDIEAS